MYSIGTILYVSLDFKQFKTIIIYMLTKFRIRWNQNAFWNIVKYAFTTLDLYNIIYNLLIKKILLGVFNNMTQSFNDNF